MVAVIAPEAAVIVACPTAVEAVQVMMLASQAPPHSNPPLEIDASVVSLLLNVMSAATVVPAEFCATAERNATCPWFNESAVGVRTILATALGLLEVPLQPAKSRRARTVTKAAR